MRYLKVSDSMIAGTNYQKEGLSKDISLALAKNIDLPIELLKLLSNALTKTEINL